MFSVVLSHAFYPLASLYAFTERSNVCKSRFSHPFGPAVGLSVSNRVFVYLILSCGSLAGVIALGTFRGLAKEDSVIRSLEGRSVVLSCLSVKGFRFSPSVRWQSEIQSFI